MKMSKILLMGGLSAAIACGTILQRSVATEARSISPDRPTLSQIASNDTALPMTIRMSEEVPSITVPDRNTTASAYGGRLRRYDVHIAKMFEVTHFMCRNHGWRGSWLWVYRAGGGNINMGRFEVSCRLANDFAVAYGLGAPERTTIYYSGEEGARSTRTYDIPIFNITGGKVSRWMDFTQNFQPL